MKQEEPRMELINCYAIRLGEDKYITNMVNSCYVDTESLEKEYTTKSVDDIPHDMLFSSYDTALCCVITISNCHPTLKEKLNIKPISVLKPINLNKGLDAIDKLRNLYIEDEMYDLERKIYCDKLESEIKYAEKFHKWEELLGCTFEFIEKVLSSGYIYLEGMNVHSEYDKEFKFHRVRNDYILNSDVFIDTNPEFLFINRWGYGYDLRLKDYKKTWWLKQNKEE